MKEGTNSRVLTWIRASCGNLINVLAISCSHKGLQAVSNLAKPVVEF